MLIDENNRTNNALKKCIDKKIYHSFNSQNAKGWDDLLSIIQVLLTSSLALTITILSVTESNKITTTVVPACLVFMSAITSKIKDSYKFLSLHYRHQSASDDYHSLELEFNRDYFNYESVATKIALTEQKNHLQEISNCKILCCFKKQQLQVPQL